MRGPPAPQARTAMTLHRPPTRRHPPPRPPEPPRPYWLPLSPPPPPLQPQPTMSLHCRPHPPLLRAPPRTLSLLSPPPWDAPLPAPSRRAAAAAASLLRLREARTTAGSRSSNSCRRVHAVPSEAARQYHASLAPPSRAAGDKAALRLPLPLPLPRPRTSSVGLSPLPAATAASLGASASPALTTATAAAVAAAAAAALVAVEAMCITRARGTSPNCSSMSRVSARRSTAVPRASCVLPAAPHARSDISASPRANPTATSRRAACASADGRSSSSLPPRSASSPAPPESPPRAPSGAASRQSACGVAWPSFSWIALSRTMMLSSSRCRRCRHTLSLHAFISRRRAASSSAAATVRALSALRAAVHASTCARKDGWRKRHAIMSTMSHESKSCTTTVDEVPHVLLSPPLPSFEHCSPITRTWKRPSLMVSN
eukprot:scaffold39942_cov59-Phaeocystis_antarctica.AAC.5